MKTHLTIPQRVRLRMVEQGVRANKLCEDLGFCVSSFSQFLNEKTSLQSKRLQKVFDYLDM